jgi:hypothetical protein
LVAFAAADPIIYNNGAPATTSSAYSSQLDTVYPFNSQVADDFVLQSGGNTITDVHWWGIWWNAGPPGNATAFNIIFYADDPANPGKPTGSGMADPTSTNIAIRTLAASAVGETADPFNVAGFHYDAVLSPPVTLAPGHYWMAIQSVNTFPPQWGWADNGATAGNACQGFPLLGYAYWQQPIPNTVTGREMAFYLTGVPEPASLLLLGLAGLLIRRR